MQEVQESLLERGDGRVGRVAKRAAASKRTKQEKQEERIGWLFVSPFFIGFVLFTVGPMLVSFFLSFTDATLLKPAVYVGVENYANLFSTDEIKSLFWKTLYNTSYYVLLSVPLGMALAFGIAILLNQKLVGEGIFRTLYYLPSIIPSVAVSLLWVWIFHQEFGLLNAALRLVGIAGPAWLTSTQWAKPALILVSLWGAGGGMLIFLAGLQGVPTDLYDAAKVDGAGAWSRFRHVTIPMMSPTLFFVLVTNIIASFQVFVTTLIMTNGGPANATLMYVLYLYRLAFVQFRMGPASALAWVYFLIIMGFAGVLFATARAWVYYESDPLGRKTR
jgi:multiple sugar transport system permease protein